jgi:CheY-like chemotaxis protein
VARVLIVEDHPFNLKLLAYLVRMAGHEPLTADSGAAGLRLALDQPPDLIFCDIHMPGVDGFDVVARLAREMPRRVPVVAVTALAMAGDREKILAAGFDGYLVKPVEVPAFLEALRKHLPAPSDPPAGGGPS